MKRQFAFSFDVSRCLNEEPAARPRLERLSPEPEPAQEAAPGPVPDTLSRVEQLPERLAPEPERHDPGNTERLQRRQMDEVSMPLGVESDEQREARYAEYDAEDAHYASIAAESLPEPDPEHEEETDEQQAARYALYNVQDPFLASISAQLQEQSARGLVLSASVPEATTADQCDEPRLQRDSQAARPPSLFSEVDGNQSGCLRRSGGVRGFMNGQKETDDDMALSGVSQSMPTGAPSEADRSDFLNAVARALGQTASSAAPMLL